MDKLKWIIFAVVVLGFFAAIIWFNQSNNEQFTGDVNKTITEGPIADHVLGNQDQKVVFIEYGDYQCPGCGKMNPTVKALVDQYSDKITFIYRHYPLTNIHPNAFAAATAAEAAGLQGKFWEMHNALFDNQEAWSNAPVEQRGAVFEGYASGVGLDINKYKEDLTSSDISDKINRDRQIGRQIGVNQTPTFVLNGQMLSPETSTDPGALQAAIEAAIKEAYPDQ